MKKSLIEKKLEESGEKAKLEEYLRQKLIDCGWKDELKKYCLGMLNLFNDCVNRFDQKQGPWKDQSWWSCRRIIAKGTCIGAYQSQGGFIGKN